MSNYSKSTNFATKDNLTPGDPLKIVRGTEIDTEFNNIATAIATKTDNASAAIVGGTINDTTIGATTASTGAFTTLAASGNVTLSGGTANGVTYLNGSKVVTSGSALTFDGTTIATTGKFGITGNGSVPTSSALEIGTNGAGSRLLYNVPTSGEHNFTANGSVISFQTASAHGWYAGGSEQMRLTSTGLGIGTSSPAYKLDVRGVLGSGNGTITSGFSYDSGGLVGTFSNHALGILTNGSVVAKFDTSGNLGLGVTPSAWYSLSRAIDLGAGGAIQGRSNTAGTFELATNAYLNTSGSWTYKASSVAANLFAMSDGTYKWNIAPSGTAGDAITFTQAATLTSSGDYLVGTTSSQGLLSNTTKIVGGNFITRQATTASLANTATEDITGLISGAAYTVVCRGDTNTTTFVIQSVYVNGAGGVTLGLISNGNGFALTSPANNTLRVTGLVTTQTYTYSLTRIF